MLLLLFVHCLACVSAKVKCILRGRVDICQRCLESADKALSISASVAPVMNNVDIFVAWHQVHPLVRDQPMVLGLGLDV